MKGGSRDQRPEQSSEEKSSKSKKRKKVLPPSVSIETRPSQKSSFPPAQWCYRCGEQHGKHIDGKPPPPKVKR